MLEKLEKILGKRLLVLALIAVLGLTVYSDSLSVPFILDDFGSIANNKSIRDITDLHAMWEFYSSRFLVYVTFSFNWTVENRLSMGPALIGGLFRIFAGIAAFSITYLLLALKWIRRKLHTWVRLIFALVTAASAGFLSVFPDSFLKAVSVSVNNCLRQSGVTGYHLTNLAIHILSAFIVFLILNNILRLDYFRGKLPGRYKNLISTVSALVFISHPMQVNAVTYIVQRIASLATLFYLLAVLFFILYRTRNRLAYFILTLLFTAAAMFSKENTITIPFMLILIEFMFFLRDGKTSWLKRGIFLLIILSTVLIIPATQIFLHGYSQSDPDGTFKASTGMSRFVYFYTELNVIMLYLRLLIVPDRQCFDYSNDFVKSYSLMDHYSYISFAVLILIALSALYNWKKNKLYSFGVLWFFISLSVESSFISIKDVYFEHRLYLPLAGFIAAIAGLIFAERKRKNLRQSLFIMPVTLFLTASLIMIPFYSALTVKRNYVYSDPVRLWADVVQKAPGSDRGHSALAAAYMDKYAADGCKDNKYYKLAEKEFKLAIKVKPDNSTAHCNYAKLYYLKKNYQKCIDEANIAVELEPSVYSYNNLGNGWKGLGNYEKALAAYREGYNIDKECSFIIRSMADLYYDHGDYAEAYIFYQQYNNLYPSGFVRNRMDKIIKDNPYL